MQLVQTTRDALLKPLSTVVGIVERRHTLPILANILLCKKGNRVDFVATDLEIQITTHADIGLGDIEGEVTVAARKLLDILKALPDTGDVHVTFDNSKLIVKVGKSRFQLQTLAASDFPLVSKPAQFSISLMVSQKTLRYLLNRVHFAMAQQDIRYYLNGMLLVFEPNLMRSVATDGHRMAHCAAAIKGGPERQDVIVPRKTVLEMLRLLNDSDEAVNIDVAPGQIRFRFGDIELISKLVEGKFPDFDRVIPKDYQQKFEVSRELLQGSLQRAAILTMDKFKGVRLQLSENQMKISSSNAAQEEGQEEIDIDYNFNPLDLGFNVSYLLDMLGNVKTESVVWAVKSDSPASAALITVPNDDQFKYVVMPMRI